MPTFHRTRFNPTQFRATKAILLLKQLRFARSTGDCIILPDTRVFSCREYDNCFENGDCDAVVVLIMQAHKVDEELREAFTSGLSARYVDAAGWAAVLADHEAQQPAELPLS